MCYGQWLGGVGVYHGLTFNFGSAKVCSPTIFETCFSYIYGLVQLIIICTLT